MQWLTVSRQGLPRTVNGNRNGLVESVTISTDECRDLSEPVELEILFGKALARLSLDDLDFDVVGPGHCKNGS